MKQHSAKLRQLLRRAESGAGAITFQVIGYTYMLFLLLALVYDFGGAIYVQQTSKSAVVVAAQELAKDVDTDGFFANQEVQLKDKGSGQLMTEAQQYADMTTGHATFGSYRGGSSVLQPGRVEITQASIEPFGFTERVVVRGEVIAPLPVLNSILGIPNIRLRVEAYAAPEFGIQTVDQ
jgi:hypothetical protein